MLWTVVTDEELALAEDLPEGRQLDAVFAGPGEPRIGKDELELDELEGVREFLTVTDFGGRLMIPLKARLPGCSR